MSYAKNLTIPYQELKLVRFLLYDFSGGYTYNTSSKLHFLPAFLASQIKLSFITIQSALTIESILIANITFADFPFILHGCFIWICL